MDSTHLHLTLNHFPIIGTIVGTGIMAYGYFTQSEATKKAALWTWAVMALIAIPVFLTGEPAEESVEGLAGVSEAIIEQHEEAAELAIWVMEVCRAIRKESQQLPIIFLTAKDTVDDAVFALETGANDFIRKPFSFEEMLARIRVLLRSKSGEQTVFRHKNIEMNLDAHRVTKNGAEVELTQAAVTVNDRAVFAGGRSSNGWPLYGSGQADIYQDATLRPATGRESLLATEIAAIKIYPNPVKDVAHLMLPKPMHATIRVCDIAGCALRTMETDGGELVEIPVGGLPTATYLVQVVLENGQTWVGKMQVE